MTISRVGVATGTTSATVPAHHVGDLIIIFAFNGASTTVPTVPAGYQSILSQTGTTCAGVLGFKVATATNDASGTWTNASDLTCHVYRSSNYLTGSSLFIGGNGSSSSTTNTVNYPALTMIHADNTSWALGFGGVSNTTETINTAPSGMTNQSSLVGASASVAGHDTNGTVTSWSSTNATTTGAAGNSVSCTAELIENLSGTAISNFVQHRSYAYVNTALDGETMNNFLYPIDPTLAGNGLVVTVAYPNGVTPAITDDKNNTWPASGAAGTVTADAGAGLMVLQAFVLASAATGTSQITVAFGSSTTNPVRVWITQLFNVTATINTSSHAAAVNSGGIISPGSITPSVGNCLVLAYMAGAVGSGASNNAPALIVPETGYNLNDADISMQAGAVPSASQFQLQSTATATTPQFYLNQGNGDSYNVVSLALTTGSQGTAKPSGPGVAPWVDRICYFGAGSNLSPTSWLLQVPSTGNCGVLVSHMPDTGTPHWTGVTDSDGTSWTFEDPTAGAPSGFVNTNQTAKSSRTITISINATNQNIQVIYYDVSNCATSPVVATAAVLSTGVNNLASAADQPDITPTAANQLTIAYLQIGLGPSSDVSVPSGTVFDLPYASDWKGTASIATTNLTVSTTTWGSVAVGEVISGAGVSKGTAVTGGSASPWTIQPSQTESTVETMFGSFGDGNTISWGNGTAHFFNGASVAQQKWTWSIANQPSNTVSSFAIILAGLPAATGVNLGTMRLLMGVGI